MRSKKMNRLSFIKGVGATGCSIQFWFSNYFRSATEMGEVEIAVVYPLTGYTVPWEPMRLEAGMSPWMRLMLKGALSPWEEPR